MCFADRANELVTVVHETDESDESDESIDTDYDR